jgi:hypothetical protein
MLFEISLQSFMKERGLFFDNGVIDLFLRMPQPLRSSNEVWLKALRRLAPKVARAVNADTGHSMLMHPALAALLDATSSKAGKLPLAWRWQAARQRTSGDAAAPAGHSAISWPRFDWMIRNHEGLRTMIADTLGDPAALPPALFDHAKLQALLQSHLSGQGSHRTLLFTMLTFGRWHRRHGGASRQMLLQRDVGPGQRGNLESQRTNGQVQAAALHREDACCRFHRLSSSPSASWPPRSRRSC